MSTCNVFKDNSVCNKLQDSKPKNLLLQIFMSGMRSKTNIDIIHCSLQKLLNLDFYIVKKFSLLIAF